MSYLVTIRVKGQVAGFTVDQEIPLESDAIIELSQALDAAQDGSVSAVASDFLSGTITMASSGHTISTADVVDLYWTESGVEKGRFGVTAGTVSGNDVPVSGGSGDLLPSVPTTIAVAPRVELATNFDGDDVVALFAKCSQRAHVTFVGVDNTTAANPVETDIDISPDQQYATGLYSWWEPTTPVISVGDGAPSNPLEGNNVQSVFVSNGGSIAATVEIAIMYDSTP